MLPSTPADFLADWRTHLAALHRILEALDSAMKAGHWEQVDQLAPRVDQALHDLLQQAGRPLPEDAAALRQALTLVGELQACASARRQQILPLLEAWRTAPPPDSPLP